MRLSTQKLGGALAALLGLAAACGRPGVSTEVASADISGSAVCPGNAGGNKHLTVMSRNLYLGADLTPILAAGSAEAFVGAVTGAWLDVVANDFSVRADAIADEIAEARPHLVGLQEAYLWRTQTPGDALAGGTTPATDVAYDYVALLLAALADRGLEYRVVSELTLFDFEAPTALGLDVRTTDRSVILARADVRTARPRGAVYETLLPISVLGQAISLPRGWTAVDAKERGAWVTFVNTHTEAYAAEVRVAQAAELAAILEEHEGRVILVGDLNSEPGTESEAVLADAGFEDAWALAGGGDGLTCCFPELLSATEPGLGERIDYVLLRGAVSPRAVDVVGEAPEDRVGGLWPSDHAGVVAALRLGNPRFLGLEGRCDDDRAHGRDDDDHDHGGRARGRR
jgi:endonuclease/exonuclease/phosphatase family metal-dependent hydrolase